MSNLHPIFNAIATSFAEAPALARRAEYEALLRTHDWTFEWSDDASVYRKGNAEFKRLRELQPVVDPEHELWNQHAPLSMRRPTPQWQPGKAGA